MQYMKYVLFTGATGGLGEPCVKALSETQRWTVFAAGTNAGKLAELGKLPNVVPLRLDVTDQKSVDEARAVVGKQTRALDAVVNFAGAACFTSLVEGDCVGSMERLLEINVLGTARVNRAFVDLVLNGRGRIINCSSESGWMKPQPFSGAYALSKHALEAYSDSLRRELMYLRIPVIKIQPGAYKTQITDRICEGFDRTAAGSKYYKDLLRNMKPLMMMELGHGGNVQPLVRTVLRAVESRRPRLRYRIGTGKLLWLMEFIPDGILDTVYMYFYTRKNK
jgi:NAD(P)-dependent dehydrogenase (short-subunit alcohol dehydrogenase family)